VAVDPELVRELRELVEALDRRLPHVERAGESEIARDAAALRERAVSRLRELTAETQPEAVTRLQGGSKSVIA
jgi:hypothetical protein